MYVLAFGIAGIDGVHAHAVASGAGLGEVGEIVRAIGAPGGKEVQQQRFAGITRLYTARDIAEQEGTIHNDYTVARQAADDFFNRGST